MTTTTLTFLVILLSITTLTFFILSLILQTNNNKKKENIKSLYTEVISIKETKLNYLTILEQLQKDKETLEYKLQDELRYQEEQIAKARQLAEEEAEEKIKAIQHQLATAAKDNKELLDIINNNEVLIVKLEKVADERLEEIKKLTNTET